MWQVIWLTLGMASL
ncbi:hypothetical protein LINPERPRIM_LOCUS25421 [Linum perenne]